MPFTVSHVAAVLPLRSGRLGTVLATPPLVIGSMAPDLPSVVGALSLRYASHTMWAALTVDVAVTAVGCVVWALVLRPVVADLVPALALRWDPPPHTERSRLQGALLWYLAAAIGCVTHVVWDAFTHAGGPGRSWIPIRRIDVWIFETLQVVSSIVGLAILVWWSVRWWRTHPPRRDPGLGSAGAREAAPGQTRHRRILVAMAVVVGAAVWAAAVRVVGSSPHAGIRLVVDLGFGALAGALVGALFVAVVYRVTLLRNP